MEEKREGEEERVRKEIMRDRVGVKRERERERESGRERERGRERGGGR